jgi:hypothetical protein
MKVSTRFICSSNPFIFWFAGYCLTNEYKKTIKADRKREDLECINVFDLIKFILFKLFKNQFNDKFLKFIFVYFISYSILGTLLFSNFYPFT